MIQENATLTKLAIELAGHGLAVFPVKPKDKIPATPNGFKDAATDPEKIAGLFAKRPRPANYNIGAATGPASNLWVLDLDGPQGIEALDELQRQHEPLPETVSVSTGGGGRHLYFRLNGVAIKNRAKIGGKSIDVRGDGGYVVVPPSVHESGKVYKWENEIGSTPIAEAPGWLIDLVTGKTSSQSGNLIDTVADQVDRHHLEFTVAGTVDDLATAPGASEGQRHDQALRLIGSACGRGLELAEVARQAVDWARRCSPPLADDEVLKIVSDLFNRQGSKIETTVRNEVEAASLPEPVPWPVLDEDAYQGLAGEIVRTIEPQSEADPVAILLQLLVSFGNLVGRKPFYTVEGTSHHANLFAVLVGETARGRKGTSEGRVRSLFELIAAAWVDANIKNGLVSGEGLIWHVRDPIYKVENIKDKGRIVGTEEVLADAGVSDKRLFVVEPEFASVLRVCRRDTNTLSPTLRSAWDTGTLRTLAKNSPAKATDAHISIAAHITLEELRRALPETDCFSGFANRFLWSVVRRSKLLPDGGQDLDLGPLAKRLEVAAMQAMFAERMERDPAAARLWRQTYAEIADDDATGLLAAVTSRAEAQVLRLSMIYSLLDEGGTTIEEKHLRAALAVWRYCQTSARLIFGDSSGDPLADRVLEAIRAKPGIGRWELHSTICKHKPAAVLIEVLTRLRDAGKIEAKVEATAGRSAETWFPVQRREERVIREESTPDPDLTSHNSLSSGGDDGLEEVIL